MGYSALIFLIFYMSSCVLGSSFSREIKCIRRPSFRNPNKVRLLSVRRGGSTIENNEEANQQLPVGETESNVLLEGTEPEKPTIEMKESNVVTVGQKSTPPGFLRKSFPAFPWHQLPNWLTFARCFAIPGLVAVFYMPGKHVETSLLFAFASLTDFLDGYLARRWDVSSSFGAFLDPVADKLMVSTALILLAGKYGAPVAIPSAIILAREIGISALRVWMAQRGLRDIVKVGFQGKLKTALTMVALTSLLLVSDAAAASNGKFGLFNLSKISLYLCTVITVTSGSAYLQAALPYLLEKK